MFENGVYSFHRPRGGPPPSRREVFGVENRRSVECRREIATVRCVCNAGLHHCNGQMYLQPSVAPPSPVGARIARPFVPDVITAIFREGARRVIGATAKPLYPIDGKAVGLDRRNPKTSLFEGGGPSADGGRSERRSARPRGLGGDFEFLPLKSPRNPITPFETSRVATLDPEFYKKL